MYEVLPEGQSAGGPPMWPSRGCLDPVTLGEPPEVALLRRVELEAEVRMHCSLLSFFSTSSRMS
jgi:hypothetical protein